MALRERHHAGYTLFVDIGQIKTSDARTECPLKGLLAVVIVVGLVEMSVRVYHDLRSMSDMANSHSGCFVSKGNFKCSKSMRA